MIVSNNLTAQKTHYETIGVNENVSQEEIRRTYRSAILNYHPDKLQQKTWETSDPKSELESKFLEVQRAWEVLSNPRSRALYDNELRTLRQDAVTAEDVTLDDMIVEEEENFFQLSYDCRCGDLFSIDSSDMSEMGYLISRDGSEISLQTPECLPAYVILPCGSCSLKVKLVIDGNVTLHI